ncbi:MAG: eukaryotic-like serine/threonine-protein kinase [Solirubrobacteraceae bacterium]|jgi:serine/threonine-protein kinase|nr:eukaryotic-like serine/threonine-protein kinase [Solirubrobacteraceae bacterium]
MSSQVGTLLSGRYRLDAQIGAGGMSTVYRAFDTLLERQVAIKLMHREIASDSDQLERFRREARAVALLNHPHVVGVIDAGDDKDPLSPMPYIVFEYVEGETLKDRIRRHGRLPVGEAVAYGIEIARALGAAHDRRIVHRDVKPQNVLIDEEGTAKITDFGIARSLAEEGLTADGRVLGTTDYVSPEQALGQDVGPQSDIYSLGIVLFEMLTGDVPFHGENQVAVAMKHVREELPDVQLRRPEVSSALASVVDRATARDLDQRYATDQELIDDLEDVLAIETARSGHATGEATAVIRTLPSSTRRRLPLRLRHPLRLFVALLLVGAAVAVVLVVLAAGRAQHGAQPIRDFQPPAHTDLVPFSLKQDAAEDYDPFGSNGEHHAQAKAVVDGDTGTFWSTETYEGGTLNNKPGVGIYVIADPTVAAREMQIITPTKGWDGSVYVAKAGAAPKSIDGWTRVGDISGAQTSEHVGLDTARNRYRYYLVWITKLPPGASKVEIAEIRLFR